MTFDSAALQLKIGIVGSGAMGRGIAQIAAAAGLHVMLYDQEPAAVAAARASIANALAKLVEKGRLDAAASTATQARLEAAESVAQLADADIVVEAIVERLDVKRELIRTLEALLRPAAVIASNTSSLSITAIAAGARHPERIIGWHFFNPVPLMKVVEVVDGLRSLPAVGDAMMALSRRLGHTPVRAQDTPGFIVNHAGRGYTTEALRIVGEGVCSFADVDRVMREACGFRLGPFELMDLTGLDVSHPVMESIYHQFYEEPRFRPSVITAQRFAAGVLGRKTRQGFYDYTPDAKPVAEVPAPVALPGTIWVEDGPHRAPLLAAIAADSGGQVSVVTDADRADVLIVTPLGVDTTSAALARGLDPVRTVALDVMTPLALRRTLMTNPRTSPEVRDWAHALFGAGGVAVTVIRDSAGFIAQRILSCIVNIAADMAQQRIASPVDIDLAVRLGLNYPAGPLALGDALGAVTVVEILRNIERFSGDPRYRPSPWLTRRALLSMSLAEEGT